MSGSEGLGAIFLAHLAGGEAAPLVLDNLDEILASMCDVACAAWPELIVDRASFVRYVAERIPPGSDLRGALAEVHAADLYLACACAHQVDGALRRFDERHVSVIAKASRQYDDAASFASEVRQDLWQKLFVTDGDKPPRILSYAGRSPLAAWVRVSAQRTSSNLLRSRKALATTSLDSEVLLAPGDPELDVFRSRYRMEFQAAFQAAMAKLEQHDRMILSLCFVKRWSHSEIARSYKVHQTTVTRRIAKAKSTLLEEIQRDFRERLQMSPSDLHSIVHLIASQINLSLSRWFADVPG